MCYPRVPSSSMNQSWHRKDPTQNWTKQSHQLCTGEGPANAREQPLALTGISENSRKCLPEVAARTPPGLGTQLPCSMIALSDPFAAGRVAMGKTGVHGTTPAASGGAGAGAGCSSWHIHKHPCDNRHIHCGCPSVRLLTSRATRSLGELSFLMVSE